MKKIKYLVSGILLATSAITYSQEMTGDKTAPKLSTDTKVNMAVCLLYPTKDNKVIGVIKFYKVNEGVKIVADLKGLTPGKHGIHIHESGDCTAPDGASAGGHYNPMTKEHGAPENTNKHAGDMGNIVADANGDAHMEYIDKTMSLDGANSIIGRSVIVHANEDDLKTQPTGNSGGRIACGVIGITK